MSNPVERQVVHVVRERSHAHHDRPPIVVRAQIRGDGAAPDDVLRVALRLGDDRRRAIERRDLPDSRGHGDDCGAGVADTPRQQADAGADERRARDDERHAVADADRVALEVGVPGQGRAPHRAPERAHDRRARRAIARTPRDQRRADVRRPDAEPDPTAIETFADLIPRQHRLTERVVLGDEEPALTNQAPTVQRLLSRKSAIATAGYAASRATADAAARAGAPRRSSTANASASSAPQIGHAS